MLCDKHEDEDCILFRVITGDNRGISVYVPELSVAANPNAYWQLLQRYNPPMDLHQEQEFIRELHNYYFNI